jgi:hypothetical protein
MHSGRHSCFAPVFVSSKTSGFADIFNMRDSRIYESLLTGEHAEILCPTEEAPLLMVNLFPQYESLRPEWFWSKRFEDCPPKCLNFESFADSVLPIAGLPTSFNCLCFNGLFDFSNCFLPDDIEFFLWNQSCDRVHGNIAKRMPKIGAESKLEMFYLWAICDSADGISDAVFDVSKFMQLQRLRAIEVDASCLVIGTSSLFRNKTVKDARIRMSVHRCVDNDVSGLISDERSIELVVDDRSFDDFCAMDMSGVTSLDVVINLSDLRTYRVPDELVATVEEVWIEANNCAIEDLAKFKLSHRLEDLEVEIALRRE